MRSPSTSKRRPQPASHRWHARSTARVIGRPPWLARNARCAGATPAGPPPAAGRHVLARTYVLSKSCDKRPGRGAVQVREAWEPPDAGGVYTTAGSPAGDRRAGRTAQRDEAVGALLQLERLVHGRDRLPAGIELRAVERNDRK